MSSRRNYSDWLQFADQHQNLNTKQLYEAYLQAGGHGKKQNLLAVLREYQGYEKGEKRGQTLAEKKNETKRKEYIPPAYTPKQREKKERPLNYTPTKRDFIKFNMKDKQQSHFISRRSNAVQKLEQNIKELYGVEADTFIKISVKIDDDGYTKLNNFSILYPYNMKDKQGVKNTAKEIINNLNTYYENLAKKYSNKNSVSNTMLNNLKHLKTDINKSRGLKKADLENMFSRYGIHINSYELLTFTD